MTDAEFSAWLDSTTGTRRVLLVEIGVNSGGVETTRYVASRAFISAAADTPASTPYDDRVVRGGEITETLGLFSGAATLSAGEVELANEDGGIDSWFSDVFTNRAISMYFGDMTWPKSDFRQIYAGTISAIDGSTPNRLKIILADKMTRLESALTETKLGGTTPNADALIPLCFGECHNVTPLLTNPGTLEYAVHNGPIESIIEVRDNGVPVTFTATLSTGRFTLAASPVGAITASVQGDKPTTYSNDIGNIVQRLVTAFGRSDLRFTTSDIDTANFSAFITANPKPVGLYVTSSMTVREACEQLASSLGAKLVLSRTGLLRLVQIALPPGSTAASLTDADFNVNSLAIAQRTQVSAACKLGYCKNWTVQDVNTGILPLHKSLFAQEWLTVTQSDGTVATLHKLSVDVDQENTLLLVKTDAQAESTRRLTLRSTQRNVYQFAAAPHLLELGNGLQLTTTKLGLSAGTSGMIVSLQTDWLSYTASIGVLA